MLRFTRRWHDASNSPLHREARLLWFANVPQGPGTPADDEDEGNNTEETPPEGNNAGAASTPSQNASQTETTQKELELRKRVKDLLDGAALGEKPLEVSTVLGNANGLKQTFASLQQDIDFLKEKLASKHHGKYEDVPESEKAEIQGEQNVLDGISKRIDPYLTPLLALNLEKWERGEMTPGEFLTHFSAYNSQMLAADQRDETLTPAERNKRLEFRTFFYNEAVEAVRRAHAEHPPQLPFDRVRDQMSEQEIWALYEKSEKDLIIRSISNAAGVTPLMTRMQRDIDAARERLEEEKLGQDLQKAQRTILEELRTRGHDAPHEEAHPDQGGFHPMEFMKKIGSGARAINETMGIEWMTLDELISAFKEVAESIKEVKKRKSASRIARAALTLGRAASLIPGMGGSDLVNVLDELLDHKNNEIKDAYKKELGNPREDLGFGDLFIGAHGQPSRMQYYMDLGDTNRTRAILEYAAGKALLYGIEDKDVDSYLVPPGNYTFREVLPPEWSNHQVKSYFENLRYQNNQGQEAQVKAGEALVKGRDSLEGYLDPFKAVLNGMSLWLAKGIAEAALRKVKKGEMSTSITLIVLDAWEHNPIFRKYVPMEWLARFSGDSKQLLVGMLKYDQAHLVAGARGEFKGEITNDLAKADASALSDKPDERGKQRLGPLVVAARKYVLAKDPSLKDDPKEFFSVVAQVLASQTVKRKNGAVLTLYSPELIPYHIKYKPNEMRGALVEKLGDDLFIERSEIINSTSEVVKAIGIVDQTGFSYQEKARYFFSHIIDNYEELAKHAKTFKEKADAARRAGRTDDAKRFEEQRVEMARAAEAFLLKRNPELNLWIAESLSKGGAKALLEVQHKDQDKRYLVLTLLRNGLISLETIKGLHARGGYKAATELLEMYKKAGGKIERPELRLANP